MAVEVKMPQLGESVHEGTIGKWLRAEGDTVEKYDPLLEVITDKVDTEITASHSGTLLKIVVPEGQTVQVGTVLALIGEAGEAIDHAGDTDNGAVVAATDAGGAAPARPPAAEVAGSPPAEHVPASPSTAAEPARPDSADAARISPLAARVAADHGVDPAAVKGTGRGGQVTRQDVERHVSAESTSGGAPSAETPADSPADIPSDTPDEKTAAAHDDTTAAALAVAAAESDLSADSAADIGFISPRVARLAAQHGIDLRRVKGTGRDGRITARDVAAFVGTDAGAPSAAATSAVATTGATAAPAATDATGATGATGATPTSPAAPAIPSTAATSPAATAPAAPERHAPPAVRAQSSPELVDEILELSPMRRAIAEHMVNSKRTSPHVTTVHEVDMTTAMAAYRAEREAFAERGVRLTVTAIIIDALARAIAEHPLTNSSWTDQGIKIHRDINIGMAVAVPDGLIVPVIHNADEKSLVGIARDVRDLAERARDKKLTVDDVQGGTFTITNYGTLGSLFGTPVINQPQAAILGAGAIKKRVVVVESPDGDTIAIRPMMYLALTFDHRILDGASADPFMRSLIENLEHYEIR